MRWDTVYPKKYAHGFVVLCFVVVMQSFIMNSHEVFIHIHQGCFAGTGAIVRLPQCQWSKPDGCGKISQCITTTKHSKAKTVCIFLGIYCIKIHVWCNKHGHWCHLSWYIIKNVTCDLPYFQYQCFSMIYRSGLTGITLISRSRARQRNPTRNRETSPQRDHQYMIRGGTVTPLTHWGLVLHIFFSELGCYWVR